MKPQVKYIFSNVPGLEVLSCESDFSFRDHIHNGHVLWVSSSGGERFSLRGYSDILQPGCISIIEPGVVHSNGPFTEKSRHLRSFYLGEELFLHLDRLFTGFGDRILSLPSSIINQKLCWHQTIALHEEIMADAEQIVVEERIIPLFSGLMRSDPSTRFDLAGTGGATKTISRVVEYMHSMLQEKLSLEMLADIAGCTSFHLIRLFKKNMGMTPHAYLTQLRLELARELLIQGRPIADVSLQAGFSDQSHLTRRFKQRYGLTPGFFLR